MALMLSMASAPLDVVTHKCLTPATACYHFLYACCQCLVKFKKENRPLPQYRVLCDQVLTYALDVNAMQSIVRRRSDSCPKAGIQLVMRKRYVREFYSEAF